MIASLGYLSIAVMLAILGDLSRRLSATNQQSSRYTLAWIGSGCFFVRFVLQLIYFAGWFHIDATDMFWSSIYAGLPAVGITLGLITGWHYWSWLLAERRQ